MWSWGTEEEYGITFLDWKVVGEYQDPVDPNLLSANFLSILPEVASLINSHV